MHLPILCALVGGAWLIICFTLRVFQHATSPLRTVPGPFLAKFTDAWYFWKLREGHFDAVNRSLHEKYGPIVRYGPGRFSFSHVAAAKAIYGHGFQFPKSDWYSAWTNPGQPTLFADQNIKRHGQNRRLFQHAYTMSSLVSYEPYVDECVDIFSQRLREMSDSKMLVNMGHWLQCYAFDVIGCITYSRRLGFLDQGKDIGGVMSALEDSLSYATLTGVFPALHPYLFKVRNFLAGSSGMGRQYVLNYTQQCMQEHQASPKAMDNNDKSNNDDDDDEKQDSSKVAVDFLTKFFAQHSRDPETFTSYHVAAGCAMNMVAGSDTTSISLDAILYHLLKNPGSFDKLREEIDDRMAVVVAVGGGSSTAGKSTTTQEQYIGFKEAQEMPYLQAVIKEGLRLHPATGLPLERVVPAGGATICDRFFPAGSVVGINTWVEHVNPQIWGDDAREFRPERWLTSDADKVAFMNRHWMPTADQEIGWWKQFGLGSRTCIGKHISLLEISKLIPRLVRDFDFELSDDLKKGEWSVHNMWFVKPGNFMVKIKTRESSSRRSKS